MKKFLSLFLSLIIVLSVSTVTVSAFVVSDGQISLARVSVDLSGETLKVATNTSTSKKIGDKIIIFGPSANAKEESNISDNDTYFGERAVIVNRSTSGDSEGNDMRFQISMGGLNSGLSTFKYDLYMATDDCRMNLRLRHGSSYLQTLNLMELGLNLFEWYNIKLTIDYESTSDNCKIEAFKSDGTLFAQKVFTCNFTGKSLDNMFIWGTPKSDVMPDGAPDAIKDELAFYAIKNLLIYHEPGIAKSQILSVGSSGEVAHSQNEISFKLSENIPLLTQEHISAVSEGGRKVKASSVSVASDGDGYVVDAVMEGNLSPWSAYTLKIDPSCYSDYKEIYNGTIRNVTSIEKEFYTSAAPFDIKEPVFTSDADKISAMADLINTTGTARDVCFVFSVFSDGRQDAVSSKSYPSFEAVYPGETLKHETSIADRKYARFFVINGWENPVPLFGKFWTVDSNGNLCAQESKPAAGAEAPEGISIGEFDYTNKKIKLSYRASSDGAVDGTILVYEKGRAISDSQPPVFADCITTSADGSFEYDILFSNSLDYGEYVVAFYPVQGDVSTCGFNYYTASQLLEISRESIFFDSKVAPTSGILMQIIKGTDSNEEIINNNFEIFSSDADMTKYNKLKDKDSVFALVFKKLSGVGSYDELIDIFEKSANELYKKENNSSSAPSSNNKNYGSSSVAVKETVSHTPSVTVPDANIAPGQKNDIPFSDISGHWSQKSVSDLCKRGVMNGYADGTFRADNSITRAELAKILVLAFAKEETYTNGFTDVTPDSWYASYVSGANKHGIITGYENGSFMPEICVIRQDAALMLYRAINIVTKLPEGFALFSDDLDIAPYATEATRALGEIGIINGNPDGSFRPADTITRGEVAAIVCRALDYIQSH